jgi:GNAT superfamily N-acetyltransferase
LQRTTAAQWNIAVVGHLGPNAPVEKDGEIFASIAHRCGSDEVHVVERFEGRLESDTSTDPEQLRVRRQAETVNLVLGHFAAILKEPSVCAEAYKPQTQSVTAIQPEGELYIDEEAELVWVTGERLELIAPLFDAYRQFFGRASDLDGARRFLDKRLSRGESVIFAVVEGERALGFTQLYPSFSSVSMRPIWILNDLYVAEDARRRGVGARLLSAARDYALRTGTARLVLATAVTNTKAQELYERDGWRRDTTFFL